MNNLIFLGAPGSGKGTQSAMLSEKLSYSHVSTGNLLREEIAKKSELGLKVKEVMDNGQLVSDDLVVALLKSNLNLESSSYMFDGYPRNLEQAETLSAILDGFDYQAVYFELNTDKLVQRLENRRVTKDGKFIYNLISNPPKASGVCDVTGEPLIQRDDDREEIVRKRMEVFESTNGPVVDYYAALGKLIRINANESVEAVYSELISKIK
jgi:adenylate kinase